MEKKDLKEIGFYTLSDERCKNSSETRTINLVLNR